jgi:phosphate transport system permease protein
MHQAKQKELHRQRERLIEKLLVFCAALFIIAIALITIFIFAKGLPLLLKVGLGNFLFSSDWRPDDGVYGIGAMVVGTVVLFSWRR